MRLIYAADHGGTAFCEIAYPHRLRWPVLGRMIEMSIDKRGITLPSAASSAHPAEPARSSPARE